MAMPSWIPILLLTLATSAPPAGSEPVPAGPEMELVGSADFGTVELRRLDHVRLKIRMRYNGAGDIRVRTIAAGCGCIEVMWPKEVTLAPGESVETEASLDPLRASLGTQRYVLQAITSKGTIGIGHISYTYEPPLSIRPRVLWLAPEPSGILVARGQIIASRTSLGDLSVTCASPAIDGRLIERDAGGWELVATLKDGSASGPIGTRIYVHPRNEDPQAGTELRLRGNVPYGLIVSPPVVLAADKASSDTIVRELQVTRRGVGSSTDDLQVTADSMLVTIQSVQRTEAGWQVRLRMNASRPGLFEAVLIIRTVDQQAAPVRLVWKGATP